MSSSPTYPTAHAVAPSLHTHFAACQAAARDNGDGAVAPLPDIAAIARMITAAFWASLRREEGRSPRISLAYVAKEHTESPLLFARPLMLDPATLTKLAPAVERPAIHLGIWASEDDLRVWGTTRTIPRSCFVIEVVEPGLLVIKRRRGREGAKFANIAVLQGDQIKMVEDADAERSVELPAIASILGYESSRSWTDPFNVVVQLAISMRAHGRGGSLLVVPDGSEAWRESIVRPVAYSVEPAYAELRELVGAGPAPAEAEWRDAMQRSIDLIAGLTAVDGATIISDRYSLLAFGVKITRRSGGEAIDRVAVTEPVIGVPVRITEPSELGGTRHLSAAQFVHDQRDSVALVASQDGRFTAFVYGADAGLVRAHRVESLLL